MFRIISIIGLVVTFGVVGLHYVALRGRMSDLAERMQPPRRFVFLRRFVYLVVILSFLTLALTGFYASLITGEELTGYLLMLHATAAPVFAVSLAVLALFLAHDCRFTKGDWQLIRRFARGCDGKENLPAVRFCPGQKLCFWLIILLAVPVMLSMVLSMFALFGTDGQVFLYHLHRYSGLSLLLVAILFGYLSVMFRA